jgi:hypothetical protein
MGLCLLLFAGCSGGARTGTVSGNVTVDGQPLADGTISFNPIDGNTPTSGGKITNGSYSVEVPTGAQKIIISAQKVTGSRAAYEGDPNSPRINITAEILPKKYSEAATTELTLDVKRGSNKKDFTLSTMP